MRNSNEKKGIAIGATVLIIANFIVKIIGVIYKVPLANILGQDGMGYLSSAYEIYQLMLTIFASGGAVAVSKMVAESIALNHFAEVRKEVRVLFFTFFVVGGTGMLIMFFGSGLFASRVSAPEAEACMMVLSPAIFFLSLSCVFRGYYQGQQNMKPTGLSQVIEACFKLLIGIGFALLLKSLAYEDKYVAAGAISGTTISTMIGMAVVLCIFFSKSNRMRLKQMAEQGGTVRPTKQLLLEFAKLAVPLTLSSMVVNLTGVLDLFLIYQRLQDAGLNNKAANAAYGAYKGYAQTLFNLPPSIISSLNISIIPALSAAFVARNKKRILSVIRRAFKLVIALAMPCAVGLVVMAGPILRLLFPARLDEVDAVIPLLQLLGVACFWTCLATLSTATLQSVGRMNIPVYSLLIGGVVKLLANYILIGIPSVGMIGAPIGTLLCYITIFTLNWTAFRRHVPIRVRPLPLIVKPAVACALMAVSCWGVQKLFASFVRESLATLAGLCVAVVVYGVVIMLIGGIDANDVRSLPKGNLLVKVLKKVHLLRDPKSNPETEESL